MSGQPDALAAAIERIERFELADADRNDLYMLDLKRVVAAARQQIAPSADDSMLTVPVAVNAAAAPTPFRTFKVGGAMGTAADHSKLIAEIDAWQEQWPPGSSAYFAAHPLPLCIGVQMNATEGELWRALGKWSIEICRPNAELAPPQYLIDAVKTLAAPADTAVRDAQAYTAPPATREQWLPNMAAAPPLECKCRTAPLGSCPRHGKSFPCLAGVLQPCKFPNCSCAPSGADTAVRDAELAATAVPREPTEMMLKAIGYSDRGRAPYIWRAMYDAAPAVPAAQAPTVEGERKS